MKNSFWTPAREAKLRELWGTKGPTLVARELGCSRSAMTSKAIRLGLYFPPPPVNRALLAPVGPAPACCCWPLGEPRVPGFRFCNAPLGEGARSYCATHARIAYVRHS